MPRSGPEETELQLRVTLIDPPVGARFCVQRGKAEHVEPKIASGGDLTFNLSVRALTSDGPIRLRLLGPFVQGPPKARFVYICSGTLADQADSPWTRRAKVPLASITADLVDEIRRGRASRLGTRIAGRAKDGGPACATVELLGAGWEPER